MDRVRGLVLGLVLGTVLVPGVGLLEAQAQQTCPVNTALASAIAQCPGMGMTCAPYELWGPSSVDLAPHSVRV
jgi:lysozyme family protein